MKVVIKYKNGMLKKYEDIKIFEIGLKLIHITKQNGELERIERSHVKQIKQTKL